MAQLTIEEIGARLYVRGNTFPVKDRLRAIGKGKRAELES